ncbi:MAG: hypothetical protein JJV88_05285 [Sulfurovum sp.]|nr:hypothetical protein [Sulfurovaceae bacterium]
MQNNFEAVKIKKAKENLIKNLDIAKRSQHVYEESKKESIFMMLMQLWYRIFRY